MSSGSTFEQLVKDVVVSFLGSLMSNTRFFQQVSFNVCSYDVSSRTEFDSNKLTKPRRVVVSDGLSITKRFQNRVSLKNLLLQSTHFTRV
jgi:hypothetical protein